MAKEVMNETVVGLALVISFVLIVSLAAAEIPAPPPVPSMSGDGSSTAPPLPGTPDEEDSGAPSTPGVPPSPSGDSGGTSRASGGGGDYGRRHAGDTYSYGDESVGDSSGAIETAPRAPPTDSSSGYIPEVSDDATEQRQETEETTTTEPPEKKGYVRLIILIILILLAIGAIIWAVIRWRHHHEEESAVHKEMEAVEKNLYLKKDTPKSPKKPAGKGPLPPGMR